MSHNFEKGDSNRCRNIYEKILHDHLGGALLAPHKKCAATPPAGVAGLRACLCAPRRRQTRADA